MAGTRRAPRKRVRAGWRKRERFGPVRLNFTQAGLSSVSAIFGFLTWNSRTGDVSVNGPGGVWFKIRTSTGSDGGTLSFRRIAHLIASASYALTVLLGGTAIGGYATWQVKGDDLKAAACQHIPGCGDTPLPTIGGDR